MPVTRIDIGDSRQRRRFTALEHELLANEPLYVPEMRSDIDKRLQGRSPFYEEVEQAAFVAGDRYDLARCVAFVNRRWQRDKGEDAGFIGYFAGADGAEDVVHEMLGIAESWLAERGASRVIAPYNAAAFHGLGAESDAFDEDPMFPFPWQPPHYPELLESCGYRPTYPFWIFDVDLTSAHYERVSGLALNDARCTIRTLDKKRWSEEMEALTSVFNETMRDEWEFHAMTNREFREPFDEFKPVLDPRQFLFADVDGEVAGFCFGLPDWTPLIRSLRGRMGPTQIVRLMLGARRYRRAGLLAIGVRDAHRGKHIGQTLAATLYGRYRELGLTRALYYAVNDRNLASRRLAESLGGTGRILYHCYDKRLA